MLTVLSLLLFASMFSVSCDKENQSDTGKVELTIDYRWPDLQEGVNYLENPIPIIGRVSDPEAEVWVYTSPEPDIPIPGDATTAMVTGFDFEGEVLLKPGKNLVTAVAKNSLQTAYRKMSVQVTDNGSVIYVTGKSDGTSLATHSWIQPVYNEERWVFSDTLNAGDTRTYDVQLNSNYGFSGEMLPAECRFEFWQKPEPSSFTREPLPEGMTITIEPSVFLAYMHTTYDFRLTITTSESVLPGIYYIWWRFISPDMP
ncbi:MAG: hypothetical protein JW762_06020, partial [Dehalococcoidales bacterium]|nr:hypothetical protein [Dehalococcoidales bacterium]